MVYDEHKNNVNTNGNIDQDEKQQKSVVKMN